MLRKVISSLLFCITLLCLSTCNVYAYDTYDVPSDSSFKTFMDYGAITNKSSKQYKLQEKSVTNANGLRIYDNRYTIALGTAFNAPVGTYVDVVLSTGYVLQCVVGDLKQNAHTDASNLQVAHNGNIVEFIVDKDYLSKDVRVRGDVSYIENFDGYVDKIIVYKTDEELIDYNEDVVVNYKEPKSVLITDKYSIELPSGENIYILEYDNDMSNSFSCDEEVYSNTNIGSYYFITK